jgi:hypothetical protein
MGPAIVHGLVGLELHRAALLKPTALGFAEGICLFLVDVLAAVTPFFSLLASSQG